MHGASRESLQTAQEEFERAVADLATEQLQPVARDLFQVVGVLTSQVALRRALSDPAMPAERKSELAQTLFGERISAPALQGLQAVVTKRWAEPGDVIDAVEMLGAAAAFALAEREGVLDEVEDELFRFSRIVDSQPDLRAALTDPGLPGERKVELLKALLEGKVAPPTLEVLDYVVTQPRGRTFERGVEEFARLAAARRERVVARVTSAVALDEAQQERLSRALARVYGREVQLQVEVDADLLGGVVVRVGDEVIDGSIAKRIDDVRRRLTR
jgi:F-type H+-transporting ATPase subunit delta